jgi:hypothetical protein
MLTNQPVARLALHSGRVTGVVMGSGELIAARKGVLLTTGGYGADPQMSWEFEQLPGFAHEGSGLIPQSLTGSSASWHALHIMLVLVCSTRFAGRIDPRN